MVFETPKTIKEGAVLFVDSAAPADESFGAGAGARLGVPHPASLFGSPDQGYFCRLLQQNRPIADIPSAGGIEARGEY
jgi:hypothetical protein